LKISALKISHDTRILLLALAGGFPGVAVCIILLYTGHFEARFQWLISVPVVALWLSFCFAARGRVAGPLRTLANLLEALREGDYSIRARVGDPREPLGEAMLQVNAMAATLRDQRLGALEATALLRKVMEEIEVAIFAFDPNRILRLVNHAGEKLLAQPAERLMALDADTLDLAELLDGETELTIQRTFAGATGRWRISRSVFRQGGVPHRLLVVTDLTRPLREEELQAWQRIVRVLGHELNNSLTPIRSIAQSLEGILKTTPLADDWADDMSRGLNIISTRSESLSRFMSSYARLAKLPPPRFGAVEVNSLLRRAARIETRMPVFFEECPPLTIPGDADQLEQVLINLIRNAVDAAQETGGRVYVRHDRNGALVEIVVRDEGPGLSNTANLFVPYFTTKRGGSGIGLVLSRQIAEAHNGTVILRNAANGPGCEAVISLPAY
jgi:nitrogen fixation/metabolism regulation signal transduction histidine kinase